MAISPVNMVQGSGAPVIPTDLQLTPDFRLREFAVSAEYPELADAMQFTEIEVTKLFYLCSFILQPLRDLVGRPITILSGKRTPELNQAVGGSKTSQHLLCEAVDFTIDFDNNTGLTPDLSFINLRTVFNYLEKYWNNIWRQLIIYYTDDSKPRFIHISIPHLGGGKPRGAFSHYKGQYSKVEMK